MTLLNLLFLICPRYYILCIIWDSPKIIRDEFTELAEENGWVADHESISVEAAAKLCLCSKQTIFDLINDRSTTRFPGAKVSAKTYAVNRAALIAWLNAGGLLHKENNDE